MGNHCKTNPDTSVNLFWNLIVCMHIINLAYYIKMYFINAYTF